MSALRRIARSLLGRSQPPAPSGAGSSADAPPADAAGPGSVNDVCQRLRLQVATLSDGRLAADAIDPAAHLFDHGYLDSLSAATFLAQIEDDYGIAITEVDLVGRLASLEALARHLHREATP
jgi:acyl carrier protein